MFGATRVTYSHLAGIFSRGIYHQATIRPVDEERAEFRRLDVQPRLRGRVTENYFACINGPIGIRVGEKQPALIPSYGLAVKTVYAWADGDLGITRNRLAACEIHRGYELINASCPSIVVYDGVKARHCHRQAKAHHGHSGQEFA